MLEFAPIVRAVPVRMMPLKVEVAPIVSPDWICQNTFLATAPPVKAIWVLAPVVTSPATWKIHTSLGPPLRVNVVFTDKFKLTGDEYKPGASITPSKFELAKTIGLSLPAASL